MDVDISIEKLDEGFVAKSSHVFRGKKTEAQKEQARQLLKKTRQNKKLQIQRLEEELQIVNERYERLLSQLSEVRSVPEQEIKEEISMTRGVEAKFVDGKIYFV